MYTYYVHNNRTFMEVPTMVKLIPAATLRTHMADALKSISGGEHFLLVTRKNKPVSALVNLDFFEDLLAAASKEYRKSIREARDDYKKGRLLTHHDIFGQL